MSNEKVGPELDAETATRAKLRLVARGNEVGLPVVKERSLARTSKLVNRLKKFFTEPNSESYLAELNKLELSMYIEEVSSALLEAYKSMRLRDVWQFMEILCHLHAADADFGESLLEGLRKQLDCVLQDNLRFRIHLRILTEGILVGIFPVRDLCWIFESTLTCTGMTPQVAEIRLTVLSYWIGKYAGVVLVEGNEGFSVGLLRCVKNFYLTECPVILKSANRALQTQEAANVRIRIAQGGLDGETQDLYEGLRSRVEKLQSLLDSIRASLSLPVLELAEPEDEPAPEGLLESGPPEPTLEELQFGDAAGFYLDLLDLAGRLPRALLNPAEVGLETVDGTSSLGTSSLETPSLNVTIFLSKLDVCTTQEEADRLTLFWFEGGFQSRGNRKHLAKHLLVNRDLPHSAVCRFLANIAPHAQDLVSTLVTELRKQVGRGSAFSDSSIRAVRLLAELCKFLLCPIGVVVEIFKSLLDLFSPAAGELAAWLLIGCGRFLLNRPEVKEVVEGLVTRLVRLREMTPNLPPKVALAIDDAVSQAKPPLVVRTTQTPPTPLQAFIFHLLHVEVYRMDEDAFLTLVRRLPWKTCEHREVVLSTFKQALLDSHANVNFEKTFCVASLLAGLVKWEESLVVEIVDAILEQFQLAIEKEDFRQSPTRVRTAKLIAELYAFRLIGPELIFDLLYHLIGFRDTCCFGASCPGVLRALVADVRRPSKAAMQSIQEDQEAEETEETVSLLPLIHPGAIDEPAWSFVRTVLICTILSNCGEFFLRGKWRRRLDRFLLLFRRYLKTRPAVPPVRIQNLVSDTLDSLGISHDWKRDSLEAIEEQLAHMLALLADDQGGQASEEEAADEEGGDVEADDGGAESSSGDFSDSQISESSSECSEFHRGQADAETALFDRELHALMVESVAEARSKRVTLQLLQNHPPAEPPTCDPTPNSFRVLLPNRTLSATPLQLPETHRLREGQEGYRIEREQQVREKQQLKRFILSYQRREGGVSTLGEAPGEARAAVEFDPLTWSNKGRRERRKYRR